MSWFNRVGQGSYHQQQPTGFTSTNIPGNTGSPVGPAAGLVTQNPSGGAVFASPSPLHLPSAPHRGAASPLSLENLSRASQSAGQLREPEPISYVILQEQRCVLSWFQNWTSAQKERFLNDLLGKAVPGKVCTLLDSLSSLQVKDKLPNIFECQLHLWTQWFESWGEDERNHFLHMLEEQDSVFVAQFYMSVAGTAGRD
ncbi:uncharacterized protein C14orf119 homolog [Austrofundulus limnaeus]|uniref:Uncharacterized protein C14orf119 homolog n=1 Tax=Austrofundulus limnaeus TaxID=52670 RepID=A0A2I4AIK0_AUSLI|nr:PREDICTED: uncharacterized protein C14orf119 homolog [Austrofundulus limnaeus]